MTSIVGIVTQRATMKRAFVMPLQLGSSYFIVSNQWFNAWKVFVDYEAIGVDERSPELIAQFNPGPMINKSICLSSTTSFTILKPGMTENSDFVIVSKDVHENLMNAFGGESGIERFCVSPLNGIVHVELYPPIANIWTSAVDGQVSSVANCQIMLSKYSTLRSIIESPKLPKNNSTGAVRLWLKTTTPPMRSEQGPTRWTVDITDRTDDGWRLIRLLSGNIQASTTLMELLMMFGVDCSSNLNDVQVDLLVEVQASHGGWPREALLESWKSKIAVGDHVDAKDKKTWYESIIMKVLHRPPSELAFVHYRGWETKWDATVDSSNMQPLFTQSRDWRKLLAVGDELEYLSSVTAQWYPSIVLEINIGSNADGLNDKLKFHHKSEKDPDTLATRVVERDSDSIAAMFTHAKIGLRKILDDESSAKLQKTTKAAKSSFSSLTSIYRDIVPDSKYLSTSFQSQSGFTSSSYSGSYSAGNEYGGGSSINNNYKNDRGECAVKGAAGLRNLGNTCFMNSTLQCLSNTVKLRLLVTSSDFKSSINLNSKLGYKGKLAIAFGDFMKEMWNGGFVTVAPTEFKNIFSDIHNQFRGYEQHDAQEFLNILLDGLHEELNSAPKLMTNASMADDEVGHSSCSLTALAETAKARYQDRNKSAIVDSFAGQLKSVVTCSHCGHSNSTFDPYMCLSLPVPSYQLMTLLLFRHGLAVTYEVTLHVASGDTVKGLKQQLLISVPCLNKSGANKEVVDESWSEAMKCLCVVPISLYNTRVTSGDLDDDTFCQDGVGQLVCYELLAPAREGLVMNVLMLEQQQQQFYSRAPVMFAMAYKVTISPNMTLAELHAAVWSLMSQLLIKDSLAGPDDHKSQSAYTLWVSSTYGDLKSQLPNDSSMPAHSALHHGDTLACLWTCRSSTTAQGQGGLRFDQAKLQPVKLMCIEYIDSSLQQDAGTSSEYTPLCSGESNYNTNGNGAADRAAVMVRKKRVSRHDDTSLSTTSPEAPVSIYKCLDKFTEQEQLARSEVITCSHCHVKSNPFKKIDLWSSPEVLVLHLKRFRCSATGHREKIMAPVQYPVKGLDLSRYVVNTVTASSSSSTATAASQASSSSPSLVYDLHAVSEHMGGSNGGHYTATCLNCNDNQWHHFNDSLTSLSTQPLTTAVSENAYVLYYHRRT